jgi:hypothetical protein
VLTGLAGWSSFALLLLILISQPLRMLAMRVVFKAFGVPQKQQIEWALKESKRHGALDLIKGFWNRQPRRRPNADVGPLKRFRAPRGADDDAA